MNVEDVGAGTVIGAVLTAFAAMFAKSKDAAVEVVKVEAEAEHEERENTRDFAIRTDERAARYEQRIEVLTEQVRKLSVDLAIERAEKSAAIAEATRERALREAAELGKAAAEAMTHDLVTKMSLATQLLDRMRVEVATANANTAEVRAQYDAFVEQQMKRNASVPPGATA